MDFIVSLVSQRPMLLLVAALPVMVLLHRRVSQILRMWQFEGPWLCRFTELPHVWAFLREDITDWYAQVSRKYGPLAVVSPGILATSSADMWTRMNTHAGYEKSTWYYRGARFDWRGDNVFTEVDIPKHDALRKKMIPGYSGSENLTLEGDVDICVRELVALIRRGYGDGRKPMDLAQKLQFLTLDVISTLGFGQCFGLLEADADPDEYLKSTEDGLKINNRQIGLGTWWTNWIPFVGPCADPDMATARGFDKILALSNANVEVRERAFRNQQDENGQVGGDRGRPDMLTSFLKNGLSGQTLKSEVVLQIVAGSDTTAGGLRGVMLYLLTNPRVYRRLQGEIDDAVKHGLAPAAPDVISHAQARKLPYLQAVIREAMRVFPPITNPLARDVPRGGDVAVIDGQKVAIPEGVSIIPSFTEMYRSAGLFGDDADVFRPERWIEELDPKRLNAMKKANDQVFGAGRWMCLGKNVAMLEMSKVIFELLRNFDWGLINPEKPWKIAALIGLRSITDFWVHVQERS